MPVPAHPSFCWIKDAGRRIDLPRPPPPPTRGPWDHPWLLSVSPCILACRKGLVAPLPSFLPLPSRWAGARLGSADRAPRARGGLSSALPAPVAPFEPLSRRTWTVVELWPTAPRALAPAVSPVPSPLARGERGVPRARLRLAAGGWGGPGGAGPGARVWTGKFGAPVSPAAPGTAPAPGLKPAPRDRSRSLPERLEPLRRAQRGRPARPRLWRRS